MTALPQAASAADEICRRTYRLLARRSQKDGLDSKAIRRAANDLCIYKHGRWHVKEEAYRPTGIALGCPLPDSRTTRRLGLIACRVERMIAQLQPTGTRWLSYVPSDWYHITVLNRTHYRVSSQISALTADELRRAESTTHEIIDGPLTILLAGLLLTQQGVLMVPGFPADDTIYRWRIETMAAVPELGVHPPPTVHIKIGHLLADVRGEQLDTLLAFIARCGQLISARLQFSDAYTPLRRISLSGDN